MEQFYIRMFLIILPMLWVIIITSMHFYLKSILKEKHDDGFLWIAGAFLIWFFITIVEDNKASIDNFNFVKYWNLRKLLSLLNSTFLIFSLSYFKDNSKQLENFFNKIGILKLGAGCLFLGIVAYFYSGDDKNKWLMTETCISIFVIWLLFFSLAAVFKNRGIFPMAFVAIATGIIFSSVQMIELFKEVEFYKYNENWDTNGFGNELRFATRPLLVICILVQAISWMRKQLQADLHQKVEEIQTLCNENEAVKVKFEEASIGVYKQQEKIQKLEDEIDIHKSEIKKLEEEVDGYRNEVPQLELEKSTLISEYLLAGIKLLSEDNRMIMKTLAEHSTKTTEEIVKESKIDFNKLRNQIREIQIKLRISGGKDSIINFFERYKDIILKSKGS